MLLFTKVLGLRIKDRADRTPHDSSLDYIVVGHGSVFFSQVQNKVATEDAINSPNVRPPNYIFPSSIIKSMLRWWTKPIDTPGYYVEFQRSTNYNSMKSQFAHSWNIIWLHRNNDVYWLFVGPFHYWTRNKMKSRKYEFTVNWDQDLSWSVIRLSKDRIVQPSYQCSPFDLVRFNWSVKNETTWG